MHYLCKAPNNQSLIYASIARFPASLLFLKVELLIFAEVKKVKCTLVQALRLCTGRTAHRRSRGIALPFLDHGTRRGEWSASRLGRSLPQGKTRYPFYRRMGGSQRRSGQVRKISPSPGFDSWTVQPVAGRYTDWAILPQNIWRDVWKYLLFCPMKLH
jgi:hypothetical protein